jgi:hypothetical protein
MHSQPTIPSGDGSTVWDNRRDLAAAGAPGQAAKLMILRRQSTKSQLTASLSTVIVKCSPRTTAFAPPSRQPQNRSALPSVNLGSHRSRVPTPFSCHSSAAYHWPKPAVCRGGECFQDWHHGCAVRTAEARDASGCEVRWRDAPTGSLGRPFAPLLKPLSLFQPQTIEKSHRYP